MSEARARCACGRVAWVRYLGRLACCTLCGDRNKHVPHTIRCDRRNQPRKEGGGGQDERGA
jgi:hypothetical protein